MKKGFTLIELLVVIGVVAVLAVTVTLTLNPVELLRQARDSDRISSLTVLNKAMSVYLTTSATQSMGTSSVLYLSLPDSSGTCASHTLPAAPGGYTYSCQTSSAFESTDGTGWVPVNFTDLEVGAPFSALPTDPLNTDDDGSYFMYITGGGRYAFSARMESDKFQAAAGQDNGSDLDRFEVGTNLALVPATNVALSDDFNDNSISTARWTATLGTGTAIDEVSQRLELTPRSNGVGYALLTSSNTYDLVGKRLEFDVVQLANQAGFIEGGVQFLDSANNANRVLINTGAGYLLYRRSNNGSNSDASPGIYDYPFTKFAMEHTSSTNTWRFYSYNAGVWTLRHAPPASTWTPSAVNLQIFSGSYGSVASPGKFIVDNVLLL